MESPKITNATKFLGLPLALSVCLPSSPTARGKGRATSDLARSPASGAGPAPPGWRSWWPWSCSAPPLCCTTWWSGSHSLPSARPAPSPNETVLQPGWDTGPGQVPPQSPRLSGKHKDKPSGFPAREGRKGWERVWTEEWVLPPFTANSNHDYPQITLSQFSEKAWSLAWVAVCIAQQSPESERHSPFKGCLSICGSNGHVHTNASVLRPRSGVAYNQTASLLAGFTVQAWSCKQHTKADLKLPKLQASRVATPRQQKSRHHFQLLVSHQNSEGVNEVQSQDVKDKNKPQWHRKDEAHCGSF